RTRGAGSLPGGTPALPYGRRRGRSACLGCLLLAQAPKLLLAPPCPPFVEVDPPVQDEVDEGRILAARQSLDLTQDLQVLLVPALATLEELQRLLVRQGVGEEEAQERLVPQLDRGRRAEQPVDERLVPGGSQLVDAAVARAVGRVLAFHEAVALEPAQLRID